MSSDRMTRRSLLIRSVALPVIASVPVAMLAACGGGELSCTDESSLSTAERDARRATGYADHATDASRACSGCMFFTGSATACGTCTVVRGPINPGGTCNLFAARA